MKEKMKLFFDSRATWTLIGAFVGGTLGEPFTTVVNAIGLAVMAVI